MSFLNPVSEPVLRFSSTDADAPQIDHNSRVAGDVKALLKACLVTGYGAKAGAGWTTANEVDHVCEFVSPSAAMSDYRLGIDDSTATKTDWYYQYQDARTDPADNAVAKNFTNINLSSGNNGWQLLVTAQGVIFIEILDNNIALGLVTRVTYFGRIKSALKNDSGKNIAWWSLGHNGGDPTGFFGILSPSGGEVNRHHFINGNYNLATIVVINARRANAYLSADVQSSVEMVSPWYLYDGVMTDRLTGAGLVGEQPAVLLADCNNNAERFRVIDKPLNSRPTLSVPVSYASSDLNRYNLYTRTLLIYTDTWEY